MRYVPQPIRGRFVFVDTSAYYAHVDARDAHYAAAQAFWRQAEAHKLTLFTTNFVLAETHALILNTRRLGYWIARRFVEGLLLTPLALERVLPQDEERAWAIICQYEDKPFTYVDATSFAVMERLGVQRAFAFDDHFRQYGFTVLPEEPGQ